MHTLTQFTCTLIFTSNLRSHSYSYNLHSHTLRTTHPTYTHALTFTLRQPICIHTFAHMHTNVHLHTHTQIHSQLHSHNYIFCSHTHICTSTLTYSHLHLCLHSHDLYSHTHFPPPPHIEMHTHTLSQFSGEDLAGTRMGHVRTGFLSFHCMDCSGFLSLLYYFSCACLWFSSRDPQGFLPQNKNFAIVVHIRILHIKFT